MHTVLEKQILEKISAAGLPPSYMGSFSAVWNHLCSSGLKINSFDLLEALIKRRRLFKIAPNAFLKAIQERANFLGVDEAAFTKAAISAPRLFTLKLEILDRKVGDGVKLLGITRKQYIKAGLRFPALFGRPQKALENAAQSAKLLKISRIEFIEAACEQPTLFFHNPFRLVGNVTRSVVFLNITRDQFVKAALAYPSLFYSDPETIYGHVKQNARALGISEKEFVAIALKQPNLFLQSEENALSKIPYIKAIMEALGSTETLGSALEKVPPALKLRRSYLHARYILAKLGLKKGAIGSVIMTPNVKTTALITCYYLYQRALTGRGGRVLQILYAKGMIQKLPEDIQPLPPRTSINPKTHARKVPN